MSPLSKVGLSPYLFTSVMGWLLMSAREVAVQEFAVQLGRFRSTVYREPKQKQFIDAGLQS